MKMVRNASSLIMKALKEDENEAHKKERGEKCKRQ